jgi:hypothetical protein
LILLLISSFFLLFSQLEAVAPSQNWDLSGECLFWYASEQASSNWANATVTTVKSVGFVDEVNVAVAAFDWDYGFRVGAGRTLGYDQWDIQLYWARFHTVAQSHIPTTNALINTVYLEFDGSFLHGDQFLGKGASVNWSLLFNMFDWELGRTSQLSRALFMRPFIGIKGGWIDQTIHATIDLVTSMGKEKLENNFWGIGPSGGVNTTWEMGRISAQAFNLLGDFVAATMWGNWDVTDIYTNSGSKLPVTVDMPSLGALMLRGFLGIGWSTHTCRTRLAVKLGYEMQIWFNQLRLPSLQQLPLHGDLTLQGGTLNVRFDF